MLESEFQKIVRRRLQEMFPTCVVLKTDPTFMSGIPDLLILVKEKWFALECKCSKDAKKRPNQEHYVSLFDQMAYCKFIYPENMMEVLYDLQQTFSSRE